MMSATMGYRTIMTSGPLPMRWHRLRFARCLSSSSPLSQKRNDPIRAAKEAEKLEHLKNANFRDRIRQIPLDQEILDKLQAVKIGRTKNKKYKGDKRDFVRGRREDLAKVMDIKPRLFKSCVDEGKFPREGEKDDSANKSEVAFVGRSNVGKSSLLNVLAGTSIVAKVSSKPGETRHFNFYRMPKGFPMLVDMPGYGFSFSNDEAQESSWLRSMNAYVNKRKYLKTVYLLVDGRHGLKTSDVAFCETLNAAKRRFTIILTKGDLVDQKVLAKMIWYTREQIRSYSYANNEIFPVSAKTLAGISDLQRHALGR